MNLLIFGLVILVGMLTLGITFEIVASLRDRYRFRQPPGERVAVGASQLHLVRKGTRPPDQPAVVLEAGIGGNWLDWELVLPEIANMTQVVAYDRAGYGWSERGANPRTPEAIVAELHALLHHAGIEPPYILVGHSFGGIYVRLFAATYPDAVAGLILVDASHPDMIEQQDTQAELRRLRNVAIAKRIGFLRLIIRRVLYRADYLFGDSKPRYIAFNMLDSDNVQREARPLFERGITLPDRVEVPLTVISRETDDEIGAEKKWSDYQAQLVALHPQAHHIISEKSSHYIALSEPELIVGAVRTMLATGEAPQHDG